MPRSRLLPLLHEHLLLAAMLPPLHGVIWGDFGSPLSRSLMLAHLGLFLIWQPLWRSDERLDPKQAAGFVVFTIAFVAWLNWWLLFLWLLILIGLIGGRVFVDRRERLAYGVTLLILVCELVIGTIPRMFSVPLPAEVDRFFDPGLLAAPVLLLLVPFRKASAERPVDLLHGLSAATLTGVLGLGSLLVMYRTGDPYPVAVLQTLAGIAGFLFALGWLLNPHPGFSGLGQLWARYLLNVGTPFEQWLGGLARAARLHRDPGPFVEAAMQQLLTLPWVAGVAWETPAESGRAGRQTVHVTDVQAEDLRVWLYTRRNPGTALLLHGKLLVQVIAYFHAAKQAQRALARQAHLQAIFETGARVTHDIKNLLQSLYTMGSVLQESDPAQAGEVQALLRRQLPQLTHRLQLALDKLQAPSDAESSVEYGSLSTWWQELVARHGTDGIAFESTPLTGAEVPVEFLDSAVENLLENARAKRQAEPGIGVRVELGLAGRDLTLRVSDTGSPVPRAVTAALFREPVDSQSGLGIGLYQAARQAETLGYRLALARNEPGAVVFELTGPLPAPEDTVAAA
jgi:signal transduction histidine kinase